MGKLKSEQVKILCNVAAFALELIAIFVVNEAAQLELMYCESLYLYMITMGSLLFGVAGFFQKKLPWAYTRFGSNKKEEVTKKDGTVST